MSLRDEERTLEPVVPRLSGCCCGCPAPSPRLPEMCMLLQSKVAEILIPPHDRSLSTVLPLQAAARGASPRHPACLAACPFLHFLRCRLVAFSRRGQVTIVPVPLTRWRAKSAASCLSNLLIVGVTSEQAHAWFPSWFSVEAKRRWLHSPGLSGARDRMIW